MLSEELIGVISTYQGTDIGFRADEVRITSTGQTTIREYLLHPGAVVIAPVLDGSQVIFVKQYRYAIGEYTIELPAGKLEKTDKDLEEAARRELAEETGYVATSVEKLRSFYPTPAFSTEVLHLFRATGLTRGAQRLDSDESIDLVVVPLVEAKQFLARSPIVDAKTLLGILLL